MRRYIELTTKMDKAPYCGIHLGETDEGLNETACKESGGRKGWIREIENGDLAADK